MTVLGLGYVLAVVGVLAGIVIVGAPYIERALMYFPDPVHVSPRDAGLTGVEEIALRPPDGTSVLGWYRPAEPSKPTLLYFHGNAGSLASRVGRMLYFASRDYGVLMMTYRGYGGSTGSPSERENVADGRLALEYLGKRGVAAGDIIVMGESIGTGIAVQVAAGQPVGGVVLDAPYTSLVDVAGLHYPILPARWLMRDRYETVRHIRSVTAPVLILHGEEDRVIPAAMGRALFTAAPEPKEMRTFAGAGHSDHDLFGSLEALDAWIARVRGGQSGKANAAE